LFFSTPFRRRETSLFDNPTTIAAYDDKSGAFFSADCFGAIIPSPSQSVEDIAETDLTQSMAAWTSLDSPWVHMIKAGEFNMTLERIRRMAPKIIIADLHIIGSAIPPSL
jgi:flavorubredoxin